jgi:hypothetical protein
MMDGIVKPACAHHRSEFVDYVQANGLNAYITRLRDERLCAFFALPLRQKPVQ